MNDHNLHTTATLARPRLGLPPEHKWRCIGSAQTQAATWKYLSQPDFEFKGCTSNARSVAVQESSAFDANPRVVQIPRPEETEVSLQVIKVLINALGVNRSEVTPYATLVGDLGAKKIDFVDIRFRLEQSFGIKVPADDLLSLNGTFSPLAMITVQMVIDYVFKRLREVR